VELIKIVRLGAGTLTGIREAVHHVIPEDDLPPDLRANVILSALDKSTSHQPDPLSNPPHVMDDNQQLNEEQVMNGFHAFLISALRHAKVERLLDDELLASAEADLMICGKLNY
jgi:hypothetical protein